MPSATTAHSNDSIAPSTATVIAEGTSDIQKTVIARNIVKEYPI